MGKYTVYKDETLIEYSMHGDREAFSELAERYFGKMYAVALAKTRNSEEAEDVCQEAMIKAFRYIRTLKETEKFAAWLRSIVIQESYGRSRKKTRFFAMLNGYFQEKQTDSTFYDSKVDKNLYQKQLFHHAIADLSAKAREIVLLHYMYGLSCEEISDQMGLKMGTVKSHLFKAREKMQKNLAKLGVNSIDALNR